MFSPFLPNSSCIHLRVYAFTRRLIFSVFFKFFVSAYVTNRIFYPDFWPKALNFPFYIFLTYTDAPGFTATTTPNLVSNPCLILGILKFIEYIRHWLVRWLNFAATTMKKRHNRDLDKASTLLQCWCCSLTDKQTNSKVNPPRKNGREFIPTVLLYEEKWLTIFRFVILVLFVFLVEEFIRRCIHGNDLDLELQCLEGIN